MLVLMRKPDETIIIQVGDAIIEITVLDARGDRVRIGCTGPKGVIVHRKEVWSAIQREKASVTRLKTNICCKTCGGSLSSDICPNPSCLFPDIPRVESP